MLVWNKEEGATMQRIQMAARNVIRKGNKGSQWLSCDLELLQPISQSLGSSPSNASDSSFLLIHVLGRASHSGCLEPTQMHLVSGPKLGLFQPWLIWVIWEVSQMWDLFLSHLSHPLSTFQLNKTENECKSWICKLGPNSPGKKKTLMTLWFLCQLCS